MSRLDTSYPSWIRPRRPSVDDAYTARFNAQSRCTHALRAWPAAVPESRAAAHGAYLAELELEEAAARELERLDGRLRAAV